ncbi:peptidyl-tRNA hydrolase-domain-containing protein [Phyllosticta citricarpa]|uniref:peptidyl-tRNA hydrolase n=2 Tax=Phyllosticta TaxID=121621 RepID=A0ABR1LBY6_9PEZI
MTTQVPTQDLGARAHAVLDPVPDARGVGKFAAPPRPLPDVTSTHPTYTPTRCEELRKEDTAEDTTNEKRERRGKGNKQKLAESAVQHSSKLTSRTTAVQQHNSVPPTMFGSVKPAVPLFIASIGNPGPKYANTLHSAGHVVIARIQKLRNFAEFRPNKRLANGLVTYQADPIRKHEFTMNPLKVLTGRRELSQPEEIAVGEENWTLWQSPLLMNMSGKAVRTAFNEWRKEAAEFASSGRLVVLHDDLEQPLGKVRVRSAGGSHRGHNGLKSLAAYLPNTPYVKVGIGIGRPTSRSPEDVAKYVLRQMSPQELIFLTQAAGEVIGKLREIQEGKLNP